MNVSLGKKLEEYIAWQVANGPFNNSSEVVRDALRMHQLQYIEIRNKMGSEEKDLSEWQKDAEDEVENSPKSSKKKGNTSK